MFYTRWKKEKKINTQTFLRYILFSQAITHYMYIYRYEENGGKNKWINNRKPIRRENKIKSKNPARNIKVDGL